MGNSNLRKAQKNKNDCFYTQISDIEKELVFYKEQFKGKVVFCNCDDPEESNFWKYFYMNFNHLGLKKLIATHYDNEEPTYKLEYDGGCIIKTNLEQSGDFRSPESIEALKEADIIVTNPPFSLFREYVSQLIKYSKKFLIIGNQNAITYKEIFALLKEDRIWLGYYSGDMEFRVPDDYEPRKTRYREDEEGRKWRSLGNICWFTNLDVSKRHEKLILYKNYNKKEYPNYDNYNAINVSKVAEIPMDYDGYMGVPITFMHKHNPSQFELFGIMNTGEENKGIRYKGTPHGRPVVDGKEIYLRILIKRKDV